MGVACRAIELSRSMHTDGSREMYCFVGWFSAADSGGPELPDLYDHYPAWAGAVYERHMEPVWNAPVSAVRRPDPGRPGPPPWPVAPPPPVDPHLVLPPVIHVNDWDIVWNHALASPAPASVMLGWSAAGRPGAGVTHLGVLDRGVPRLDRSGPLEPSKRVGPVDPPPPGAPRTPTTTAGRRNPRATPQERIVPDPARRRGRVRPAGRRRGRLLARPAGGVGPRARHPVNRPGGAEASADRAKDRQPAPHPQGPGRETARPRLRNRQGPVGELPPRNRRLAGVRPEDPPS
ncbi:hypothetical protein ACFSTC_53760 [Nonomuraea ferruginea]